jgi:hypothetical protein
VPPDAAAEAVPLDAEAEAVAAVLRDAAAAVGAEPAEGAAAGEPAGPGALPSGLPWAWACRQDPLPPWPAPRPSAQIARAMELSPIAWLSELSWQAAQVVVLSCALGPGEF